MYAEMDYAETESDRIGKAPLHWLVAVNEWRNIWLEKTLRVSEEEILV
jgi:hypothetical protein